MKTIGSGFLAMLAFATHLVGADSSEGSGTVRFFAPKEETAFKERIERETPEVLKQFRQGDNFVFVQFWDEIARGEASDAWKAGALSPLAKALEEVCAKELAEGGAPGWSKAYETIFVWTNAKLLGSVEELKPIASAYAFEAIRTGKGEAVADWYSDLPPEHQAVYFESMKYRSGLFRRLQNHVNPNGIDPALLEDEPRLSLIEAFLSHPFVHQVQPYNNKTFAQLINFKCLTPDELFERGDRLIAAHVRQGMAFVDLARIYRDAGRYDEALNYIKMGLVLHNHTGNRLGIYLLEKTIIMRDAGRMSEAMEAFQTIPVGELDKSSTQLLKEVESSLRG